MKFDPIEQKLKRHFENKHFTPTEENMAAMEILLDEKMPQRKRRFMVLGLLVLLCTVLVIYSLTNTEANKNKLSTNNSKEVTSQHSPSSIGFDESRNQRESPMRNLDNSTAPGHTIISPTLANTKTDDNRHIESETSELPATNLSKGNIAEEFSNSNRYSNGSSAESKENSVYEDYSVEATFSTTKRNDVKRLSELASDFQSAIEPNISNSDSSSRANQSTAHSLGHHLDTAANMEDPNHTQFEVIPDSSSFNLAELYNQDSTEIKLNFEKEIAHIEAPVEKSLRFEIATFQSFSITKRTLNFTSEGLHLAQFRNSYETPCYERSMGFAIQSAINNRWLVTSGYQLSRLTDQSKYPDLKLTKIVDRSYYNINSTKVISSIDSFYVQLDNEDKLVIDTQFTVLYDSTFVHRVDTQTTIKPSKTRFINHYYHQIPLTLGHRFHFKKWQFDFRMGLKLGVLAKTTGSYYSILANGTTTTISQNEMKKLVWSGIANMTLRYPVYQKFSVYTRISFDKIPNIMNSTYEARQGYRLFGVGLGFNYTL